jgi:hypothetical protein
MTVIILAVVTLVAVAVGIAYSARGSVPTPGLTRIERFGIGARSAHMSVGAGADEPAAAPEPDDVPERRISFQSTAQVAFVQQATPTAMARWAIVGPRLAWSPAIVSWNASRPVMPAGATTPAAPEADHTPEPDNVYQPAHGAVFAQVSSVSALAEDPAPVRPRPNPLGHGFRRGQLLGWGDDTPVGLWPGPGSDGNT